MRLCVKGKRVEKWKRKERERGLRRVCRAPTGGGDK